MIHPEHWTWAQYAMALLYLLTIIAGVRNHGKYMIAQRDSMWPALFGVVLCTMLLYFGNFWS